MLDIKMPFYRLEGKMPVLCSSDEWGVAIKHNCVAKTNIGDVYVSTIFVGIDYRIADKGPPILFETMIFGGVNDRHIERYCTWDEAEAGHNRIVELLTKDPAHELD
jgi:hypothetical protein